MVGIQRAQAAEAGVDHPELVVLVIGQFVNVDIARDMQAAGHIAGIVFVRRAPGCGSRRGRCGTPTRCWCRRWSSGCVGGDAHGFGKGARSAC